MPECFTEEQLVRIWEEDAKNNLAWFIEYDGRGLWQPAGHLEMLCYKLEAVERGELKRLMVFMPPRHGKSEVASKKFPAWYLGRNPDKEIIISSYAAELAYDFSRIARNTFREWGSRIWGLNLADDSGAVGRWGIQGHRGGLTAAGVGGPITGRGANVAIIDDPIKNKEEASSKTIRDKVWDWYRSTLRTRLAPSGAIVLVTTRWHEDDLAGRLLQEAEQGGEQWEVISFPAIATEDDVLGRKPGDPLWPQRYSLEELESIKASLGSYLWSALYQQSPQPEGGAIFQRSWFRYFFEEGDCYILAQPDGSTKRVEKEKCWRFQTCDPAATERETSDYFVLTTFAVTPDKDLLILDVFRERAETTKHSSILLTHYRRWRPRFQGVENKTFGLNIIQGLKKEGLPIKPLKADTDKVSRARPVAARYELGTVYHRQNAAWLTSLEDELLAFPNGEFDDQVDTVSYAGIEIANIAMPSIRSL